MQAVLDAIDQGKINAKACCVISSRSDAYALERAEKHRIPTFVVSSKEMTPEQRDERIMEILASFQVDYVVLAGYLSILTSAFVQRYPKRIINIHPALLPKFGGVGMYGIHVHEAVIKAGEKVSGATVHYVDSGTDTGEIIEQRSLEVLADDTPQTLQKRILDKIEHKILPDVMAKLCNEG